MDTKFEYYSKHEMINNLSQNKCLIEENEITAELLLKCPFLNCPKKCKSKRTMDDHIRIHNGEKPYAWYYLLLRGHNEF